MSRGTAYFPFSPVSGACLWSFQPDSYVIFRLHRCFFSEDKADYIHNNLNRDKWCNMLNPELFKDFIDFYDENLN